MSRISPSRTAFSPETIRPELDNLGGEITYLISRNQELEKKIRAFQKQSDNVKRGRSPMLKGKVRSGSNSDITTSVWESGEHARRQWKLEEEEAEAERRRKLYGTKSHNISSHSSGRHNVPPLRRSPSPSPAYQSTHHSSSSLKTSRHSDMDDDASTDKSPRRSFHNLHQHSTFFEDTEPPASSSDPSPNEEEDTVSLLTRMLKVQEDIEKELRKELLYVQSVARAQRQVLRAWAPTILGFDPRTDTISEGKFEAAVKAAARAAIEGGRQESQRGHGDGEELTISEAREAMKYSFSPLPASSLSPRRNRLRRSSSSSSSSSNTYSPVSRGCQSPLSARSLTPSSRGSKSPGSVRSFGSHVPPVWEKIGPRSADTVDYNNPEVLRKPIHAVNKEEPVWMPVNQKSPGWKAEETRRKATTPRAFSTSPSPSPTRKKKVISKSSRSHSPSLGSSQGLGDTLESAFSLSPLSPSPAVSPRSSSAHRQRLSHSLSPTRLRKTTSKSDVALKSPPRSVSSAAKSSKSPASKSPKKSSSASSERASSNASSKGKRKKKKDATLELQREVDKILREIADTMQ